MRKGPRDADVDVARTSRDKTKFEREQRPSLFNKYLYTCACVCVPLCGYGAVCEGVAVTSITYVCTSYWHHLCMWVLVCVCVTTATAAAAAAAATATAQMYIHTYISTFVRASQRVLLRLRVHSNAARKPLHIW